MNGFFFTNIIDVNANNSYTLVATFMTIQSNRFRFKLDALLYSAGFKCVL